MPGNAGRVLQSAPNAGQPARGAKDRRGVSTRLADTPEETANPGPIANACSISFALLRREPQLALFLPGSKMQDGRQAARVKLAAKRVRRVCAGRPGVLRRLCRLSPSGFSVEILGCHACLDLVIRGRLLDAADLDPDFACVDQTVCDATTQILLAFLLIGGQVFGIMQQRFGFG